jgi:serine/threonine protein kinase
MGACLFTFVYGRIPFSAPTVYQLFQIVQTEPLHFPDEPQVSDDLKDLLSRMLHKVGPLYGLISIHKVNTTKQTKHAPPAASHPYS